MLKSSNLRWEFIKQEKVFKKSTKPIYKKLSTI